MILSDREIKAAMERGSIFIDPDPRNEETAWASTALDLRLDGELSVWKNPEEDGVPIDGRGTLGPCFLFAREFQLF